MTGLQAPSTQAERTPDSTVELKAAVNKYKAAISQEEKLTALDDVVDTYMGLLGENPTAQSMLNAKEIMDAAVVEGTNVVGEDSERPEHPNSWPNVHTKMTLYSRVLELAFLRTKSELATLKIAQGVQGRMYDLRGNDAAM